jgi:hypothetical protein
LLKAVKAEEESLQVFEALNNGVDMQTRQNWTHQEKLAMELRGDHLKIYSVNWEDGRWFFIHLIVCVLDINLAPIIFVDSSIQ